MDGRVRQREKGAVHKGIKAKVCNCVYRFFPTLKTTKQTVKKDLSAGRTCRLSRLRFMSLLCV